VYSLDKWHGCVDALRNFIKGWGRNVKGEYRRKMNELMEQIQYIDEEMLVQGGCVDDESWRKRYQLECELEKLMENEELYWQQRGERNGFWRGRTIQGFST
jgi:hypothetical protein